jgi:peptide/nickel transport system permease protein
LIKYALFRLLNAAPVVFGVVTLTFLFSEMIPGDPVDRLLGETASAEDKIVLRRELGLDRSWPVRYAAYLRDLVGFDLGESLVSKQAVATMIAERFPATLELTLASMLMAVCFGFLLATLIGLKQFKVLRPFHFAYSLLGLTLPAVILGPLLIWVFAIWLDWFPISERTNLNSYFLPALSLAIPLGAVITRMTYASLQEILAEPFIQSLRAKGLSEGTIHFKHALTKALTPVVTIVGLQTGALLTGTVITETIFDWPGLGTLLYSALSSRDYPLIQGCVVFIAVLYVLVNLFTDLLAAWLNPRIREQIFQRTN